MFPLVEHIPKLILASLIGWTIGAERALQKKRKHVGVGTCSLISMICCLLTIISKYCLGDVADPSRLIANIITAIGFLCGGVIFVKPNDEHDDEEVVGLTTGAIMFGLSALGIMIGLGYWQFAIVSAILVLTNLTMSKLFKKYVKHLENIE
ncbi:MAG: MgtC/SapB family protein [Romboutsia sp.]|nr:MgtC/SapB family protein [Romboutsia sp.]